MLFRITVISVVLMLIIPSCIDKDPPIAANENEITLYCENAVIQPIIEISERFEEKYGYRVRIVKDGAGSLLRHIKYNLEGDIYFPISRDYMDIAIGDKDGSLMTDTVFIGLTKPVLMVQKGNPKNLHADDLSFLTKNNYIIAIGNPETGSIGLATEKYLKSKGIYEETLLNAFKLTSDSKDLLNLIKNKEVDAIINWNTLAFWPENYNQFETLPFKDSSLVINRLTIGILKYSNHKQISKTFLDFTNSPEARRIFNKYGIYKDQFENGRP